MRSRRRNTPVPRKTRRRWQVPPPLTHGSEALEGVELLEEVEGGQGVILWQALRDVTLWAQMPERDRAGAFGPDAERRRLTDLAAVEMEPGTEIPLRTLARMVGDAGSVAPEQIGLACRRIADWAETREAVASALAFSQAAALACPADAEASLRVGEFARQLAESARAESWYRRTIALGRQSGDWRSYALALLGLGALYRERGHLVTAQRFLLRCLRKAKRHGFRDLEGPAYHGLFLIAARSGRPQKAQQHARAAFDAYGPSSSELPALAHDVARLRADQGLTESTRSDKMVNAFADQAEDDSLSSG